MKLDFTHVPVVITDYPGFLYRHFNQYGESVFELANKERLFYFYMTDGYDEVETVMDQIKSHYIDLQYDVVIIGCHTPDFYQKVKAEVYKEKIDHYCFTFNFTQYTNTITLYMTKFIRDNEGNPIESELLFDHQDFNFVYDCSFNDVASTDTRLMFNLRPNVVNTVRYMEKVYSAISTDEDYDKKLQNMIYRMRFIMSNKKAISGENMPPMRILFNQQPQFIFEIASMYKISPDYLVAPYIDPEVLNEPLYISKIDVDYGLNTLD